MRKKFVVLTFLLSSCVVFLPSHSYAGAAGSALFAAAGNISINVQPKRKGNRGRHLGQYKGRRAYWYGYNPNDRRYVRRVYYDNGRRYTRWIWVN